MQLRLPTDPVRSDPFRPMMQTGLRRIVDVF